ncbi:hypothetical protein DV738_g3195, partial [Chaetothyriales sp. CBS 135597]
MDEGQNVAMADVSSDGGVRKEKLHHTVTACVRCRQRKTRCDPSLPRCQPCERANAHCDYFDSAKKCIVSRTYITSLQDRVRRLNEELNALEKDDEYTPDHEAMAREASLVKFSENEESRFLGPSSGISVTRFVMEFAKAQAARRTIKEVVPQQAAEEIKRKFEGESAKPTSKVYPLISSVPAPDLPNRELMDRLVDIYMVKAQYMLPLLHEPSFRRDVEEVYRGSQDATLNFQVRLVVAISMQKLDTQYAGLADSYYLAALPYLTAAVAKKDLATLQCFALIAQYSLLTPTRTASYWVIGLAAKLCQELGICEEETIAHPPDGSRPNFLEIDMRRRLFWIICSMEYGLSHSLGRPSAFGVTVDNINVQFFQLCDDRFISTDGLLPGHHPIMKKCIAIHFFKMRLLQADIRRTLYLRKRDTPVSDRDPWFADIQRRIDQWVADCPKNDEGSGLSEAWFTGRKNTMIIFIFRPSPQIPKPSLEAALRCYDAAVFNIHLQKKQIDLKLIDITWIFTQAINMALNTVLWSISYAEVRQLHPLEEVQTHIQAAQQAIASCADRWPGVRSAVQLYENLIQSCLKAYESDRLSESPYSDYVSSVPHDLSSAASAQSPGSTSGASNVGPQSPPSVRVSHILPRAPPHAFNNSTNGYTDHSSPSQPSAGPEAVQGSTTHSPYFTTSSAQSNIPATAMHYSMPGYEMPLPPFAPMTAQEMTQWHDDPVSRDITAGLFNTGFARSPELVYEGLSDLPAFGSEYSRYFQQGFAPHNHQMQPLSQQQQTELMHSLEQSNFPDLSRLANDSNTFYTAGLP